MVLRMAEQNNLIPDVMFLFLSLFLTTYYSELRESSSDYHIIHLHTSLQYKLLFQNTNT